MATSSSEHFNGLLRLKEINVITDMMNIQQKQRSDVLVSIRDLCDERVTSPQ